MEFTGLKSTVTPDLDLFRTTLKESNINQFKKLNEIKLLRRNWWNRFHREGTKSDQMCWEQNKGNIMVLKIY